MVALTGNQRAELVSAIADKVRWFNDYWDLPSDTAEEILDLVETWQNQNDLAHDATSGAGPSLVD
jgi:hypothetical protein